MIQSSKYALCEVFKLKEMRRERCVRAVENLFLYYWRLPSRSCRLIKGTYGAIA